MNQGSGPQTPSKSHSEVPAQGTPITWQVAVGTDRRPLVSAWTASTQYAAGQVVTNDGVLYRCLSPGVSAGSGGPSGSAEPIVDGSVYWRSLGSPSFKGSLVLRCLSSGGVTMFYGDEHVTTANGAELPAGQSEAVFVSDPTTIYVVAASATTATVIGYR